MENNELLKMVLAENMDKNIKNEIVMFMFQGTGRKAEGIPMMQDCRRTLNSEEVFKRMKAVAGVTEADLAQVLGISKQALSNQKMRGKISAKSIITLHFKTGVSIDWLLGSWDGISADCISLLKPKGTKQAENGDNPERKYLSLVEIYDQSTGNSELKWCLTKQHPCLDNDDEPIPEDFGALLSLIIRYKNESGTPDRVKKQGKRHFQVRRVLAYVLGDQTVIRRMDTQAKKLTAAYQSDLGERAGKTEFRLYSAKDDCLRVFERLAEQYGLCMIEPIFNTIAWDFLIGTGSMSPQKWVLSKLNEAKNSIDTD